MLGRTLLLNSAAATESYWFTTGHGTGAFYNNKISSDSAGNVYTGFSKKNADGTVAWQNDQAPYDCTVDSAGNSYAVVPSVADTHLLKFSPTGSLLWARKLATGVAKDVAVDSSDNVYVGMVNNEISYIVKFNSSGTLQWQRQLGNTSTRYKIGRIIIDSSGNIFVGASWQNNRGLGSQQVNIAKLDSTGAFIWSRELRASGGNDSAVDAFALSSTGDIYCCIGGYVASSYAIPLVVKVDSLGTVVWTKVFYNNLTPDGYFTGIDVSADGNNVYLIAGWGTTNTIISITSAGAANFFRNVTSTNGTTGASTFGGGLKVTASSITFSTQFGALVRIPIDGSLTKTTGPYTYSIPSGYSIVNPSGYSTGSLVTTIASASVSTITVTTITPTITTNATSHTVYAL